MTALSLRSTADDVAEMERHIEELKSENESLKSSLLLATTDNERLGNELAAMTNKAEGNLVRAIQMESIMRQVSAGLVDGIKRMESADRFDVLQAHTEQMLREANGKQQQQQLAPPQGQTGAEGQSSPAGAAPPETIASGEAAEANAAPQAAPAEPAQPQTPST